MTKKTETIIHLANGGNHSPVNFRKHKDMLLNHPYTNGRLYHIVLTGSEDRRVYRKAVELLCKQLRTNGMPCRYKACYERDKLKRFHKHVFLLIEAKDAHPDTIIHYRKNHWFTEMTGKLGLAFKIAPPQDSMHHVAGKQVNYAYVPKKAGPVLDDCLLWISYLTKVRSKNGVEGQVYTASTNRETKPTLDSLPAALPAATEEIIPLESVKVVSHKVMKNPAADGQSNLESTNYPKQDKTLPMPRLITGQEKTNEGDAMHQLTPAGFNFVAGLYEKAIGARMHLGQIQEYLKANGIMKSIWQVRNDLDSTFCFYGYADSHPMPPPINLAEVDKEISRQYALHLCPSLARRKQTERTHAT
ncbi:hypothetical protein [Herbaspirillum sp. SJZ107]|uniref:hypothetical protein n=1 Tax=Herbaspirillum sp. SJZ107 TaxID=2572881 RepID=UPI001151FC41|nr:hypothetical protein [Herbaspirillum sp. SJZ107]TQK07002.1 hypothetical protein FBX97_2270 [Herbaspirillum sp. SJZ107]